MGLSDEELTYEVIGGFRRVYNHFGFGLLESAYSAALVHVWRSQGLAVEREVPVPLYFETNIIARYRIDIVVEGRLLVEVKACKTLKSEHLRQVYHYLKLTDIELALLLNFGASPEIKRFTLRNSVKRLNSNSISQGKRQEKAEKHPHPGG
jgi:GxxExxY protein